MVLLCSEAALRRIPPVATAVCLFSFPPIFRRDKCFPAMRGDRVPGFWPLPHAETGQTIQHPVLLHYVLTVDTRTCTVQPVCYTLLCSDYPLHNFTIFTIGQLGPCTCCHPI